MPNITEFHHPFRLDGKTLARARASKGFALLQKVEQLPGDIWFLRVNPLVFTHAYLLLGDQPQRFTSDLSLYLSTVKTFFDRSDAIGGIGISPSANPDARRRLSEDLGVGLAALFMVKVFGLAWNSISQIPQNSRLSRKRPDFQGFNDMNQRYLFEAKGTTKLPNIEKSLSKALDQVKNYPEQAEMKIAVVSYLSADERFFPSTSFVVDPPALPEELKPDANTSQLLHFEKVLQYAGLFETAKNYTSSLAQKCRGQLKEERDHVSYIYLDLLKTFPEKLQGLLTQESKRPEFESVKVAGREYLGRFLENTSPFKIFLGVSKQAINSGIMFQTLQERPEMDLNISEVEMTSFFPDGTVLRIITDPKRCR